MTVPGKTRRAAMVFMAASFGWATTPSGPIPAVWAQTPAPAAETQQATPLTQPQLEQMLAPIALYPDELLMQVLMASTYPLEVVQANRWVTKGDNAKLKGDALTKALEKESWDPSVKSLAPFPSVLTLMSEQLEWTQGLGDAVLAQQEDVLSAVQVLRGRAMAAGKLESGSQLVVAVSQAAAVSTGTTVIVTPPPQVITIAPAQPEIVYVPVYNPSVVYGTWPYPAQPPYYYPPPVGAGLANALLTGLAFGVGIATVGSLWGWASPNWGGRNVNVNVNRFNNINVNRRQINANTWRHDVDHRHGVAYRDRDVARRLRGPGGPDIGGDRAQSREAFRGRVNQVGRGDNALGAGNQPPLADRSGANRPSLDRPGGGAGLGALGGGGAGTGAGAGASGGGGSGNRPGGALANRPNAPDGQANRPNVGGAVANRQNATGGQAENRAALGQRVQGQRPHTTPAAFQGMGRGGETRAAAARGAASRQQAAGGGGRAAGINRGGGDRGGHRAGNHPGGGRGR